MSRYQHKSVFVIFKVSIVRMKFFKQYNQTKKTSVPIVSVFFFFF